MALIERYKGRVPTFKGKYRDFNYEGIWVAGSYDASYIVYANEYNKSLELLKSYDATTTINSQFKIINAIAIDTDKSIYIGQGSNETYNLLKLDNSGNELWKIDRTTGPSSPSGFGYSNVLAIAIYKNSSDILVGVVRTPYSTASLFRRSSSNGSIVWSSQTLGGSTIGDVSSIAIDNADNAYIALTKGQNNIFLDKMDVNRNQLFSVRVALQASVGILKIGTDGIYFSVSNRSTFNSFITMRKYSFTGTLLWSVDTGQIINSIDFDGQNIWVIGADNGQVRKYDSNGNLISTYNPITPSPAQILTDTDNNFYVGSGATMSKYDSSGTILSSVRYNGNFIRVLVNTKKL